MLTTIMASLSCSVLVLAALSSFFFLPSTSQELADSKASIFDGLACDLVKCIKGTCVNSSILPFYECQCDQGWKSPFNATWMPCVLPNCTFDAGCSNTSSPAPSPAPAIPSSGGNVCSLDVCGHGNCITNSSGDSYTCKCYDGYVNLFSKSDGYCFRECSLGADCKNLNISTGGFFQSPPPPPPPVSSSQNSNKGTSPSPSSSNQITTNKGDTHTSYNTVSTALLAAAASLLVGLRC